MVAKTKTEVAKIKDHGSKTWNRSGIKMDLEKNQKDMGCYGCSKKQNHGSKIWESFQQKAL